MLSSSMRRAPSRARQFPQDETATHPLPIWLNASSAAIDAGERLAGLNDDFAGKAPDLGAYEAGALYPITARAHSNPDALPQLTMHHKPSHTSRFLPGRRPQPHLRAPKWTTSNRHRRLAGLLRHGEPGAQRHQQVADAGEKCRAMFYWNHIARRQTNPIMLHGFALTDPIRQFNDHGYTMCSTISASTAHLGRDGDEGEVLGPKPPHSVRG